jgi:hypothetical protein
MTNFYILLTFIIMLGLVANDIYNGRGIINSIIGTLACSFIGYIFLVGVFTLLGASL